MTTTKLDDGLLQIVKVAYEKAFSVQSDFARANADMVAMAASLALITTRVHNNIFCRDWRPTVKGLKYLESNVVLEEIEENMEDTDDVLVLG